MATVGIAAIADVTTTARYFELAAQAAGHKVVALRDFEAPSAFDSLDCLIVCDPLLCDPKSLCQAPCPVVGYMIDVHRSLEPRVCYARYLDHVFVSQLDYLDAFIRLPHPNVHWLPLACDRGTHFRVLLERNLDVGFVGKLGRIGSARRDVLERVLNTFATNDYGRPYAPNEMGATYSRSKIVFNKSIGGDLNMRFFEALASGALLVTDRIENGLDKIGEDGKHFIAYQGVEDAIEKIRYYLANDTEREAIASKGQELAFAHHTYGHRLNDILAVVERSSIRRAPVRSASRATEALWRSEQMRLHGAGLREVVKLLLFEWQLTPAIVWNSAIAVGRGVIRPLRQAIGRRMKALM